VQTRKIGTLDVTVVGLGCNNFGMRIEADAAAAVVSAALDAGINFFDTADIYGGTLSEEYLGKALQGHRDEVVVATKFGIPVKDVEGSGGAGAAWVKRAVEDSLRRLGTDRIDLYQLHFPDQATPITETLGALNELVRAGKVREIGCSNFSAELIAEAEAAAEAAGVKRFASVQNEMSLLARDPAKTAIDAAAAHGLAFLPYFPLANGLLSGKYRRGEELPEGSRITTMPEDRRAQVLGESTLDVVEALDEFARARGHTLLELAFAWLLAQSPVASVIAGATKPEQVAANAAAGTNEWNLDDADLAELDRIAGAGPA